MGLLPIVVFSISFLFLVGMVSYHTLKSAYKELTESRENFEASLVIYMKQVIAFITLLKDAGIVYPKADLFIDPNNKNRSDLLNQLDNCQAFLLNQEQVQTNPAWKKVIEEMIQAQTNSKLLLKKSLHKQKSYNQFVTKMPSKAVASMFGYKELVAG